MGGREIDEDVSFIPLLRFFFFLNENREEMRGENEWGTRGHVKE